MSEPDTINITINISGSPATVAADVRRLIVLLTDVARKGGTRCALSPAEIRAIRKRVAAGESPKALAIEYLVSRKTIMNIVSRRTWPNIA